MKKIGILHLSDIHINAVALSEIDLLVHKLINDIKRVKLEYNLNIDLICFAGDLIECGEKAFEDEMQIQLAEYHFINPLLEALNLSKDKFIWTPGNHEVNKKEIVKATENGLAAISSLDDINEFIHDMQNDYTRRLQYFYDYMHENYTTDSKVWNLGYSIYRNINGVSVGIVGVDSSWRSTGAGDVERGKLLVGEEQVSNLFANIKDADLTICLMHHPLDWLSNFEMNNIENKLNNFDLVLRGHIHNLDDKQVCTKRYKTIYNTSGKIYPIDNYYSGYALIDIDMDLKKCNIYSREYFPSPREDFDKSLRINEDGKVEYTLTAYSDEKNLLYSIKSRLKEYFEKNTEKYDMLKNIDSLSPQKICDFFVEPIIFAKSESERTSNERNGKKKDTPISFEELLAETNNIMLIGKRESGKTTILQQMGIRYAVSEEHIPIYIDIRNTPKGGEILNVCVNFIFEVISNDTSLSKDQIVSLLKKEKTIFLIDNFDISNKNHIKRVKKLTNEFSHYRFMFAVEEKFYHTNIIKELPDLGFSYKTMYLDYFGKKQVREMVTKWGNGKDGFDANEMTKKIVTYCNNINFSMTPFNIAIFLTIWDVNRTFIPINDGKVMRIYLETVLDKLSSEEFQRSNYDFDIKQHFLGYLAWRMYKEGEYFLVKDKFTEVLNEYHDEFAYSKSESKFDKIFFEKNILCSNEENIFFANTSIFEYCLAYYATLENNLYREMTCKGKKRLFKRELAFYSGITNNCIDLLNNLCYEISEIILENLSLLDEIENININTEIEISKEIYKEVLINNRASIDEIDALEDVKLLSKEKMPLEIAKLNTLEEGETFFDLLSIYGNVIKNAETADKTQKLIHLDTYILGMNFQFGLIIKEFSSYITSKSKEDLPDKIKEKHPNLTDDEFNAIKEEVLDMIKVALPIGFQLYIVENVGKPKLDIIIEKLISDNTAKKFTKFMLTFLYCDIGNGNIKPLISNYINSESSKNILKLILFKLSFYYSARYFGSSPTIDNIILDLITDVHLKLSYDNKLGAKIYKSDLKQQLKKKYEAQRRQVSI